MQAPPGITYVPVPVDRLEAVYRLLAEAGEPERESGTPAFRSWTRDRIQRLRSYVPQKGPQTMLDICSEYPNQPISIRQVKQAAGIPDYQYRAGMGEFSKMLRRHFGLQNNWLDWPVEWSTRNGVTHYRMPPQIAAWWREASTVPPAP